MPTLLDDPPRPAPDTGTHPEITVRVVAEGSANSSHPRRRISLTGIVQTLVVGALAVGLLLIGGVLTGILSISNPFNTTTIDRSPPALLKQLGNLDRYAAAQGHFESTIDVEDDTSLLPSFLAGERTIFIAEGTVDATVNFSKLSTDAVQVNGDHSVTITLPEPRLTTPVIDPKTSHVASRSRGLLNRIGGVFSDNPTGEQRFYVLAQKKLAAAAKESPLVSRAETNTTKMLQGFLGKLGFTTVTVNYVSAQPAPATPAP
jgi:hypothetical protein